MGNDGTSEPWHSWGRLPSPATRLIGRERELALVCDLLEASDVRLATLTGSPGVGKTRLALASAQRVADMFVDGVAFVPLATLTAADAIGPAVAQAIGIVEPANRPQIDGLTDRLAGRSVLLVLDNIEHLLPASSLLTELLSTCPGLKLLLTSRIPTRLPGERLVVVEPLALPSLAHLPPMELLAAVPSVALFVERARAVRPDLTLTVANAASVAEICVRLDGVPLAIELAAARTRVMTSQELLARLSRALPLLTRGPTDLSPRHQTLRDAIAWSYDLLGPGEQQLFRRLGIFMGGWTLAAAEAVCTRTGEPAEPGATPGTTDLAPVDLLDGLTTLAEQSLIALDPASTEQTRFRMLETIREYARERLEASPTANRMAAELEELSERHANYFLALAEAAEPKLVGRQQVAHLDRLAADLSNVRVALEWCQAGRIGSTRIETGLRLATALWRFWELRGHVTEGWRYLADLLALQPEPTVARARALNVAGYLAWLRGDLNAAGALARECMDLGREVGDAVALGWGLIGSGVLACGGGDLVLAEALLDEALAVVGADSHYHGRITALYWRSEAVRARGDEEQAETLLDEAMRQAREFDDVWILAFMLLTRACLQLERGYTGAAPALIRESLALRRGIGDTWGIAGCIEALGWANALQGTADHAARLFGAAEALRERAGVARLPALRSNYQRAVESVRAQLDEAALQTSWAEGRALTRDQVIDEVLATAAGAALGPASHASATWAPGGATALPTGGETAASAARVQPIGVATGAWTLTRREREVAALIARGLTSREIAARLFISERTVDSHAEHIRQKLDLHSRLQIATWAVAHGLVADS